MIQDADAIGFHSRNADPIVEKMPNGIKKIALRKQMICCF